MTPNLTIIVLAVGIVIGIVIAAIALGAREDRKNEKAAEIGKGLSAHNAAKQETKEENKKKILELLAKQNNVSNDNIEKLLGVSDASASNYLQELEAEGKIEQVGTEGRGVFYKLK